MNDYGRSSPAAGNWSRYGAVAALARRNREVVIPEMDTYACGIMGSNAGHKPDAKAIYYQAQHTTTPPSGEAEGKGPGAAGFSGDCRPY